MHKHLAPVYLLSLHDIGERSWHEGSPVAQSPIGSKPPDYDPSSGCTDGSVETDRLPRRPRDRSVLYRVNEPVGRWLMIDVFMLAFLVALVKLGSIATIKFGVGATLFAAVVVITMITAITCDSRLIWDAVDGQRR